MKVTVQTKLDKLRTMLPTVQENFSRTMGPTVLEHIQASLAKGLSPVKGIGRLQRYSVDYTEAIKRGAFRSFGKKQRPINLFLSGEMLDSGRTEQRKGGVRVVFPHYLADIHNRRGAGKSKVVRHFMPTTSGEEFSRTIMSPIYVELQKLVSQEVSRQNS